MRQVTLMNSVMLAGRVYHHFLDGKDGVTWLSEVDRGVQVRLDSGLLAVIPWGNIKIAIY